MAITDNTAKWQVKKLTNFTDKDREIATQAQAEEGSDNTKVMTPLRVKNAIDKQRPLKTYTTLESIRLGNSATIDELASTMPINSMLVIPLTRSSMPNMGVPLDGTLIAIKRDGSRVVFQLICPDGKSTQYYFGGYAGWTDPKFSGWKKLATNGALSMPSDTKISINVTERNMKYIAPADGYVNFSIYPNNTNDNGKIMGLDGLLVSISTVCRSVTLSVVFLPVKKGDEIVFFWNQDMTNDFTKTAWFVYAQSEV